MSSSTPTLPDAAAPLHESPPESLRLADPTWIRRLSRGALMVAAALPLHLLAAFIMTRTGGLFAGTVCHALAVSLTIAGIWFLTAAEAPDRYPHFTLALATRAFSFAAALMWLGATVTAWRAGVMPRATVPALACMAGTAITLALYAGKLAQRIPHDSLVHQFRHFVLWLPWVFAFLIFCQFCELRPWFDRYFFVAYPLLGAFLGLAIWIAVTLVRFSLELRRVVDPAAMAPWQLELPAARAQPADSANSIWTPSEKRALARPLLHSWLLTGLGLLLVGAAVRDYRLVQLWDFLHMQFLVAELVAGAGIAFCFGGAMHYLDLALTYRTASGARLAWYWRALLVTHKRALLIGQLAAAALVVALLGLTIFSVPIPGLGL